jgi:hypothetical protein
MPTIAHMEAVLRGWYPSWCAQLRVWSTEDILLWIVVAAALLRTAWSLQKG